MNLEDTLKAYRGYAPAYDVLFGPVFRAGRRAAVAMANDRPRQRVLEVGVGTGLSLPYFRRDARITGIDVSPEMLEKARGRVARLGLGGRVELALMDAQAMSFAEDAFDTVLALYVASVVPDAVRFGAELRRVCVPGGRIVIVNHFSLPNRPFHAVERALARHAPRLGFEPDFPLDSFVEKAGLDLRAVEPSNIFGYWKLLRCVNSK